MDTNEGVAIAGRRRRRHSEEFKAQVVMASRQPGVSMAAVTMAHGINANLLRRWVCRRAALPHEVVSAKSPSVASRNAFVPLSLAAPIADEPSPDIRIATGPKSTEGKEGVARNAWRGGNRQKLRELAKMVNAEIRAAREIVAAIH